MGVVMWAVRSLISSVLGMVIFLSFLALLLVNSLSGKLLNDEFYTRALASENAYQRIYDEVLVDPEVRREIQGILGDSGLLSYQDLLQVLREVAPPEYLQAQVEAAIESSVDYFAGDTDTWTAYVELGPALDNVKPALFRLVDRRVDVVPLAQPDPRKGPVEQVTDLARQADAFFQDLAQGRVPAAAPSIEAIPASFRGTAFDSFMNGFLASPGLDPRVRQGLQGGSAELRQLFIAGDTRQFAKAAVRAALTPMVDDAIAQVRGRLDSHGRVDLVALAKQSEGGSQAWAEIQPQVDQARRWTARLSSLGLLALAGVAGGALLMGLVHLPRLNKALGWPGLTLLATGATFYGISRLMGSALLERLDRLVDGNTARLAAWPPAAVDLVTDVLRALSRQLTDGFVTPALALMAVGVALLFAAVVAFLVQSRSAALD
ncbi:MAG TPA: hypothetical protein VI855_05380 [Dehalococcoidia bacterium]|nr:hypothetical protein [Dehalococcoidia bacterium]